ncbi:receptor-like protein kinase ANXUR1 [Neltuma alba]|uniref:receptor-like protein kinase ANXUR1 n=1 Tax=Neltuma alba TaxID=207710 RepID=UPI0010A3E407|nr:receptor-like protein kinase ANXUR1 [Prosopis alba]
MTSLMMTPRRRRRAASLAGSSPSISACRFYATSTAVSLLLREEEMGLAHKRHANIDREAEPVEERALLLGVIIELVVADDREPLDSFVISCGLPSNVGVDSHGRRWRSDYRFLTSSTNTINSTAQYQDPSLPSQIPYMSARIFTSPTTYKFPVSSETRHWLRLHFYPSEYSGLDPSDAYFAVHANDLILLHNFSSFITAQASTQAYFIKEYSLLPIQSGELSITFSPSLRHHGSYAFVNGIEIVSMPEMFKPAKLVSTDRFIDVGSRSLQTMFRLNVGGQFIEPNKDSGHLSRTWYNDSPYLLGVRSGVTSGADENVTIQYPSDMPRSIAPVDVYSFARTMDPNASANQNHNLTWVFLVDPIFTYVVRLHFCELELDKINQRVFDIYVNNQTAQETADVLAWTGSRGVPAYKDYAISIADGRGDETLWVTLRPSVSKQPEYYDAILNGLEIFKVSSDDRNLAGRNPTPSDMLLKDEARKEFSSSKINHAPIIGGVAGGAVGAAFAVAMCFVAYRKRRQDDGNDSVTRSWLPLYGHSQTTASKSTFSGCSSTLSSLRQGLCRHFSLQEIRHATKNFNKSQVIGVGGFGKVYKGVIDGGTNVAIKRSNPTSEQGLLEFQTEVELLSKLRHKHLVSLIGFCEENGEMIIVYDYMANGTLREHLYRSNKPALPWKQRLKICIGAARGLHYLHTGAQFIIIHRDVKTTNILLDDKWVAKVSDFGLSKTGPDLHQTHVSTIVKGSFGYLDPEYFKRQQLTEKSDVYSFGVVLFEVICARPALDPNLPREQASLADWALMCQREGNLESIIDPKLRDEISPVCLKKFVETALKCIIDQGPERPSMGDVLWNLEFALQLQENPGGGEHAAVEKANNAYAIHNANGILNPGEGSTSATADEIDDSSTVFSQIFEQKGR